MPADAGMANCLEAYIFFGACALWAAWLTFFFVAFGASLTECTEAAGTETGTEDC